MRSWVFFIAVSLWAGAIRAQDEAYELEKQLERALAGAAQGDIHQEIALETVAKLLALSPDRAEYHFAHGVALHHQLEFDAALAEFAKASQLGMDDDAAYLAGNPLGDWKKWSTNAKRLIPPVRYRYPDTSSYAVGLRYFKPGRISKLAEADIPAIAKLGAEVFGKVPEHTCVLLLPSPQHADETYDLTVIDLRQPGTGLRQDAAAFGSPYGCYVYENFPDPNTPVSGSDSVIRSILAHEMAHGIAIRNRIGRVVSGGVPHWFEEGMAVYFESRFMGVTEKDALGHFLHWTKVAGGAPESHLVLGAFQNVPESVGLNYNVASFMVRRLVETKGKGVIRTINDSLTVPLDSDEVMGFDEKLEQVTGYTPDALFEETVAYLKEKLGADYPAEKVYSDPWTEEATGRMGGATVRKIILQEAAIGDIYSDFLFAIHDPDSGDEYGRLYEAGYADPKASGMKTDAPAGYWVYAEPYWIIWGQMKEEE